MPKFAKHGLLFVHIPKNAGRSIEAALLRKAGTPADGRRSLASRVGKALTTYGRSSFADEYLIGTIDHSFAAQHLTYAEMQILGVLDRAQNKALKPFCVVRNPYDRAISSVIHFCCADASAPSDPAEFERMLEGWLNRQVEDHNSRSHRRPQRDFVIDQYGTVVVDEVLRFETLGDDFARLMQDCGLGEVELGWRGKSSRSETYRDYLTAHARQLIEREYGADLEAFGYEF